MPHRSRQGLPENSPLGLTTHRIEAFSDGVFAIVITLLVIDLRVPQISEELVAVQLAPRLIELWPKLLSYGLSFIIVGVYWVSHHHVFHFIRRSDRTLLWLNLFFLMSVAFVPFPTALLGEYSDQELAVVIYGINVVVTRLLLLLLWQYATYRHRLVEPELDPVRIRSVAQLIGIPIGIYAIALGLSLLSITLSLMLYALVPIAFSILPNRLNRGAPL